MRAAGRAAVGEVLVGGKTSILAREETGVPDGEKRARARLRDSADAVAACRASRSACSRADIADSQLSSGSVSGEDEVTQR